MLYLLKERKNSNITLKIKYNNAFGYFIEVSKGKLSSVPTHFIMRRALVNGDRYTTEKLQQLEQELNESATKILELERDLFLEIRTSLHQYVPYLLQVADEIANTDAVYSLAQAAIVHNWIKPVIDDSTIFSNKKDKYSKASCCLFDEKSGCPSPKKYLNEDPYYNVNFSKNKNKSKNKENIMK